MPLGARMFLPLMPCVALWMLGTGSSSCRKTEVTVEAASTRAVRLPIESLDATVAVDAEKTGHEPAVNPSTILEDLVNMVADRSRFPPALAVAEERLRAWGPLKRIEQEATNTRPVTLELSGERAPILHFEIEYGRDERGSWNFSYFGAAITDPSGQLVPIYRRLVRMIRKRLGKPTWTKPEKGQLTALGWNLHNRIDLSLAEENASFPADGPPSHHIQISISEPEGEPE